MPYDLEVATTMAAAEQFAKSIGIELVEFQRFEPFEVDVTLKDGESLELSSDLTVQVSENLENAKLEI